MRKLSGLTLLLGICTSQSQVVYNINFDAPAQPANHLVLTGAPPSFVSRIVSGSPTVVPSFGGLTHQPLQLDLAGNGPSFPNDEIQLNTGRLHPPGGIDVSFDFTSVALVGGSGSFAVFFDTSVAQGIEFSNQGQIYGFNPNFPNTTFGSFAGGETFHVGAHLDFVNNQMSVFKNGVLLGTAPFSGFSFISEIRFSFGLEPGVGQLDAGAVGIDNILVVVPEPGCLSLVAVGLGLGVLCRYRLRPTCS